MSTSPIAPESEIPLGKHTSYPQHYDAGLLFPVSRALNRSALGLVEAALPFAGFDHWRAYELSWLDRYGMPRVALADILVPCESACLIESKSMKLYFNSLNQHRFDNDEQLVACISRDLSATAGAQVQVHLHAGHSATGTSGAVPTADIEDAELLDGIAITEPVFTPDAGLLKCNKAVRVSASLLSHLFRSNCPITAQPDWGSILVRYQGPEIDRESLLRYIISYRQHEGFHENCVEQIFQDLLRCCEPESLTVSINFLRRGGLEINPLRSLDRGLELTALPRLLRQ